MNQKLIEKISNSLIKFTKQVTVMNENSLFETFCCGISNYLHKKYINIQKDRTR